MTPKEKDEARRRAMERQRKRRELWERQSRLHPTAVPLEYTESLITRRTQSDPENEGCN